MLWRVTWLAGTAIPPEPEPGPEPERAVRSGQRALAASGVSVDTFAAGLRAVFGAIADDTPSTLAEMEAGVSARRSPVSVELHRRAERVRVEAEREVARLSRPPSMLERYWMSGEGADRLLPPDWPSGYTVVRRCPRRWWLLGTVADTPVEL